MSQIRQWLSSGDLRSDGLSNEVADLVLAQPLLIEDLFACTDDPDDVVRGHAADALEKIARTKPDLLVDQLPKLVDIASSDPVAVVKMHLAMVFGHLTVYEDLHDQLLTPLLSLLDDQSVFTVSWAIASLCILARQDLGRRDEITNRITKLGGSSSAAIRSRVQNALPILLDETRPFPQGWVKSEHLKHLAA